MSLDGQIEGILFWKGEAVSITTLGSLLNVSQEEIMKALELLKEKLSGRGLQLIFKDDEVMLGTRAELGSLIEKMVKEDLIKDLGKAGLETLSIILYQGPVARREIDYIRGVKSNFILRNLLIRGLIEKVSNPGDQRSFMYKPTFELLSYLGIGNIEELPEFASVKNEMDARQHALAEDREADQQGE